MGCFSCCVQDDTHTAADHGPFVPHGSAGKSVYPSFYFYFEGIEGWMVGKPLFHIPFAWELINNICLYVSEYANFLL